MITIKLEACTLWRHKSTRRRSNSSLNSKIITSITTCMDSQVSPTHTRHQTYTNSRKCSTHHSNTHMHTTSSCNRFRHQIINSRTVQLAALRDHLEIILFPIRQRLPSSTSRVSRSNSLRTISALEKSTLTSWGLGNAPCSPNYKLCKWRRTESNVWDSSKTRSLRGSVSR